MKVLLPLPLESEAGDALRLAVDTAAAVGGTVRAVAVVDRAGIERAEAGAPPGAIHLAVTACERIADRLSAQGAAALALTRMTCRTAGVPFTGEVVAGDPRREIEKAAAGCDLLVSGIASRYAFRETDRPAELPLALMKRKVIPVLLAASPAGPVRTVAVGCGGGERTARAVGAMARLGLWKRGCRLLLVAVADSPEEGEAKLAESRQVLADAGYPPWEERVIPGPKRDAFLAFCRLEEVDAVVLGGYGEHRWDDFLGVSITGGLLQEGKRHLFLYT